MPPTTPRMPTIGLALSGGGFRAAAFHLGVLQRLRELGLLRRVMVLSTVSGGSIVGAAWVCWHIMRGDTLSDDAQWTRFTHGLIYVMAVLRVGFRGFMVAITFLLPAFVLAIVAALIVWLFGLFSVVTLVVAAMVVLAAAYLCWHYGATFVLTRLYQDYLVGATPLKYLDPVPVPYPTPLLLINATGLNHGEHLVFASRPPSTDYAAMLPALMLRTAARHALVRGMPPITMPNTTPVAEAVVASSAIPGAFAPVSFFRVMDQVAGFLRTTLWNKTAESGTYLATDGGVYDNQGIHLIGGLCEHIIVSDGSASLREQVTPSTWQLWPPGKGVLWRAQEISYSRARELGYEQLEERQSHYRTLVEALGKAGMSPEQAREWIAERGPHLESYSYVELVPPRTFQWTHGSQRLPEALVPYVGAIRTDLDSFSLIEVSALMFHGYTSIDQCLRTYQPHLMPDDPPPLRFQFPRGIFADYDHPTEQEIARAIAHLKVSGSRFGLWRRLYRRMHNCGDN